jgi:plasmid stabilization system protein ParE
MLRFLRAAQVAFNKLLEFPGMGPRCDVSHPKLAGLRFWPSTGFRNYLIYYIPNQRGIRIVRVVHGSRDFHRLFEKP